MKKFRKIYIEITNVCNLNCSFCSKVKRFQKFMTKEEFKIILQKIKDKTDIIYLHVKGEPLLHKDLEDFLLLAEKYNLKVNITTNGTLLKEKASILKNSSSLQKINISLHSENNQEDYLEDIFKTVESLNKTVIYRFWTLKSNELDEKSTEIVGKLKSYYQLSTETVNKIKNENNIKIKETIYVDKDNEFVWPEESQEKETPGFCHALKTHLAILVDGTVVPCCLDSNGNIPLGNIFENDLETIINSEKYQTLKKSFQDNKPAESLCKRCTFKLKFTKN